MNSKIEAAKLIETDNWFWLNRILYRMCRKEPGHTRLDVIAGKIKLIGRSYSAAIERGAGKSREEGPDFYLNRVAPMMKDSDIDNWISTVKTIKRVTHENVKDVLKVHKKVTDLFKKITGKENRSLASKYLHFHQPKAFFIYDSIANKKIRELLKGQRFKVPTEFDSSYAEFVYRCLWYRDNDFEQSLGRKSTPRELDTHLLAPLPATRTRTKK